MGAKLSRNKTENRSVHRRTPEARRSSRLDRNTRTSSKVTQQDKAILELKKQRDILRQFQKNVDVNHEKERNQVRQLLAEGQREQAKFFLKKKRFREVLISKTQNQLDNIDEVCQGLEFSQIEMTVLQTLKAGNVALKLVLDEMMSIDQIEKLLEETQEGIDRQNEINKLFNDHLTPSDLQDVEMELKNLLLTTPVKQLPVEVKQDILVDDDSLAEADEPTDKIPEPPQVDLEMGADHRHHHHHHKEKEMADYDFPEIPSTPMPKVDNRHVGEDEELEVSDAETSAGAVYAPTQGSQISFPNVPITPILGVPLSPSVASPRNAAIFNNTSESVVEFPEVPQPHKAKTHKDGPHRGLVAIQPEKKAHRISLSPEATPTLDHHKHKVALTHGGGPTLDHRLHKGLLANAAIEEASSPDPKKQSHKKKKKKSSNREAEQI